MHCEHYPVDCDLDALFPERENIGRYGECDVFLARQTSALLLIVDRRAAARNPSASPEQESKAVTVIVLEEGS